ncbi:hypothetical protein C8R45DRAFT_940105 [Mycena sanguinolenta]|nr:hypothetical protein C8R45DRAFT_940105 [Mycena sanguinolenta]
MLGRPLVRLLSGFRTGLSLQTVRILIRPGCRNLKILSPFASGRPTYYPRSFGDKRQASSFSTADMNSPAHDHPDCICQDPNPRLTKTTLDTLMELKSNLKPLEMSPEEINEKAASDIPPREKGCCSHVLGHFHAHIALCSLANMSHLVGPEPDSEFAKLLVAAWPDMSKWLEYTFLNWIISPMFSEINRCFVKIPAIREHILAADGGMKTSSRQLRTTHSSVLRNHCLTWGHFNPVPRPTYFSPASCPPPGAKIEATSTTATLAARTALDHLDWYLMNPAPWSPPALLMLDYHIRMVCKMSFALPYLHTLLALHSVRTIVRIFVALTAGPYNETTAPGVARAISSCLEYLEMILPAADGFAWTTYAVQVGLLPAMLRAQTWLADAETPDTESKLVKLMRLLSLYSMYASLLRPLARSVRQTRELGLTDRIRDNPPVWTAYLELEEIVEDRRTMFADVDMEIQCNNSRCRKIHEGENFSSCSGCFTVSYCSSECQEEHWTNGHQVECKALEHLRAGGKSLPMSPEDYDFATRVVIKEVERRKDEILRVWRDEMPPRTPVVSLNYFSDDPRGVLVAGSPSKYPPEGYVEFPDVRELWENVISQDIHREHAIIGIYLPHGSGGNLHFMWLGIDGRVENDDSLSVVEKLIKSLELLST